tara:strand:- start:12348 stop:13079 length:732 start_codon:yes stop_codon:yes gene_type:complete
MAVAHKLKWKRILNKLKFYHTELESVKEMSRAAAPDFQEYYENFCATNNVDIQQLNQTHKDRLSELYGQPYAHASDDNESDVDGSDESAIVVHKNPSPGYQQASPEVEGLHMSQEEQEIHDVFAKLFKKIALVVHPDRIDSTVSENRRKDMISSFQKANQAFEEKKYFILLEIAEALSISTPKNYSQQSRWMMKEIVIIESLIECEKSTYNFKFADRETGDERDTLMRQFLFQLFKVQLPQKG